MMAKMIGPEEGSTEQVMASRVRYLLTGAETEGRLTMVEVCDVPGGGVPLHCHTREDEVFQVMEGEVEFVVEGRSLLARPGDVVYGPRGVRHAYFPRTPCRMIVSMIPSGIESMFGELAALPAGSPPPAIVGICARYGIEFG